jgi:hypothetical protein
MAITATIGGAVIGAGGSLLSASSQADASQNAANTSAAATNQATQAQLQMYNQTRSDLSPYVGAGNTALSGLSSFLSPSGPINSTLSQLSGLYGAGGPLSTLLGLGPNGAAGATTQLQNMPGYQFALQQGQQSLDRSAASRGLVLSGGQLKDSQTFGQGLASQQYGNTISQLEGYGTGLGGLAAQYGTYGNAIAGLVNTGENAAAQTGNAGSAAATSVSNALLTGAGQQSQALQNGGTATASGYAGAANNIGSLLNNASIQALFQGNPSITAPSVDLGNLGYSDIGTPTLSDRRAKTDIKKLGKTQSGLNIYSYRLKGDVRTQIGVMSDEVRKVAPDAVRRAPDGFDRVDYGKVSRLPAIRNTPLKRAA